MINKYLGAFCIFCLFCNQIPNCATNSQMKNMKKSLACILATTLMSFMTISEDWKIVDVVEKVKISMPTVPVEVETGGPQKIKKCSTADSTELGVIVLDLIQVGGTEEELESLDDPEFFKEQIKMGIAQSGAVIKAESSGKYKDKYTYYQVDLEITKNGKKVNNTSRILLIKKYLLTLTYQPGSAGEKKEIKYQYFNSLVIAE